MNNKNIVIAGAIAIGLYLFSKTKKIISRTDAQRGAVRKKAPPYKAPPYKTPPYKAPLQKTPFDYIRERTPPTPATTIKKRTGVSGYEVGRIAHKMAYERARKQRERIAAARRAVLEEAKRKRIQIAEANRKAAAQKIAQKVAQKVALKRIGQPTTWAAYIAAKRKAALRKAAAQKTGKKIGKTVAQKVAQKKVASWKAPYRFSNSKFRVITPSYLLKKLAKKDIARKKAVQQKKVQKTTPGTPSDKRKKRLEALYGPRWHDIWIERQKRR